FNIFDGASNPRSQHRRPVHKSIQSMLKKIGVIYGAVRKGRKSIRAARALVQALENREGVEVHLFDIRDYGLGVMESRLKDMSDPPPLLVEISEKIKSMDGLVFMTPEYNNSYSGA